MGYSCVVVVTIHVSGLLDVFLKVINTCLSVCLLSDSRVIIVHVEETIVSFSMAQTGFSIILQTEATLQGCPSGSSLIPVAKIIVDIAKIK